MQGQSTNVEGPGASDPAQIDAIIGLPGVTLQGILQLPDESLMRVVRWYPVSLALLQLLKHIKLTCKRLCIAVRDDMKGDAVFRDEIAGLLVVKDTRIPCGSQHVERLAALSTTAALLDLMHDASANGGSVHANGVRVSMCHQYQYVHVQTELSLRAPIMCPQRESLYVGVQIEFAPIDYFCEPTVPLLAGNLADLSKVPNVFRAALNLPALTHDYTAMQAGLDDIDHYMRLVHVGPHHTARDVQVALYAAEGWNDTAQDLVMLDNGEELVGDDNIFAEFDLSEDQGHGMCMRVWFPLDPVILSEPQSPNI